MPVDLSPASRAVAIDVLVNGAQSRSQLARRLGLSQATLTRVVRPLLEAGAVVEAEAVRTPGRGRSSLPLDVVAGDHRFIGVKLTTDTVYAVVTDLRARVLDSATTAEPSLEAGEVVRAVADLVARLRARTDRPLTGVGVTVGGRVDEHGTVADSPFLHWRGVPFRDLLAAELDVPVHLANDVVGLTRAQHWFGAGRERSSFALLTVGAGVGYGLVLDDRLVPTHARPVSHLLIDPHGPLCHRGHRGCLSAYVTSGAMTSAVGQARGRPVTYEEVLRSAEDGEPVAARVVAEAAHALGRAVAAVTTLTGVQRTVLSGEGVRLAEVGSEALRAGRTEHAAGAAGEDPVVRPMGFLEWARGAAVVAIREEFPARSPTVR